MTQQDTQPPAETLAECPFCGGSAQLMGFNAPEFWVSCLRIGCKAGTESFGSKERAVAAWNRRTSPALTRRAGGGAGRPLGRFGHHPDPAIDFEIEVAEIESIAENARLGLAGSKHEADRAGLPRRIELALLFQVGGDPSACAAKAKLRAIAGRDAIGQSDGDPDGWLAVKVNAEGGIVMPYGPLHAGPDRPNDARYRWAPFYLGEPQ